MPERVGFFGIDGSARLFWRVGGDNRLVAILFERPFRARTLACSRRRVRGASGIAVALDCTMSWVGTLVRVSRSVDERIGRVTWPSGWGTHH
jgi:hypothetical protein